MEEIQNDSVNSEIPATDEEAAESTENSSSAEESAENGSAEPATQSENGSGDNSAAEDSEQEGRSDLPFLSFMHNHEECNYSREDAIDAIQRGLKNEQRMSRLDYIAAQSGKSIDEVIDSVYTASENEYRGKLSEKYGNDPEVIEPLMELYHQKQKDTYQKVLESRKAAADEETVQKEKALNERIAEQFSEVQGMFPEITEFNDLPKSVRENAVKDGRDLLKEFLIFKSKENQKVSAAEEKEKNAAEKTSGSISSENDIQDSLISAMLGGVGNL